MRLPALVLLALLVAVPVTAQEPAAHDPIFTAGATAMIAAAVADQASTRYAICRGYHEAGLMGSWGGTVKGGVVQIGVAAAVIYAASRAHRTHPKAARIAVWLLAAGWTGAAASNWARARAR